MTTTFYRNLQFFTLFFVNSIERNFFSIISSNEIIEITKILPRMVWLILLNQPDIALKGISIINYRICAELYILAYDNSHLQQRYRESRHLVAKYRNLEISYFCIGSYNFYNKFKKLCLLIMILHCPTYSVEVCNFL